MNNLSCCCSYALLPSFYPPANETSDVIKSQLIEVSGVQGHALQWVARMEPVVYYMGKNIRGNWYYL